MKNGFTLVELSIVLVIIGLLIGGILVGQSLIDSAKLQSFVRQMQQYDSAVLTFYAKYKSIPGDSRMGSVPVLGVAAIKDGILTDDDLRNNSSHNSDVGANENMLFWHDLKTLLGLKIPNCPNMAAAKWGSNNNQVWLSGNGCNMARADYGTNKNAAIMPLAYTASSTAIDVSNSKGNAYWLLDCSAQVGANFSCVAPMNATEAMAYDAKIDDGISNSGSVLGGRMNGSTVFVNMAMVNINIGYLPNSTNLYVIIHRFPNGL